MLAYERLYDRKRRERQKDRQTDNAIVSEKGGMTAVKMKLRVCDERIFTYCLTGKPRIK